MDFDEYSEHATKTAIYPDEYRILYPALGLCGEAGEVAEKIKKILRDNNGKMSDTQRVEVTRELGDVLWYLNAVARDIGVSLESVAMLNIAKLSSRNSRGTLQGSGDYR